MLIEQQSAVNFTEIGAFVLPATCRPEGYLAAKNTGSLIMMKPKEVRTFKVITGIEP